MLIKAVSSTIFFFGMTWPGIEPWFPRPLTNTLPTRSIGQSSFLSNTNISIYYQSFVCAQLYGQVGINIYIISYKVWTLNWKLLFAFHFKLIPLGKAWIRLFSPQLWVNSRADWVLKLWIGNKSQGKILNSNQLYSSVNWPCAPFCPWQSYWVNTHKVWISNNEGEFWGCSG